MQNRTTVQCAQDNHFCCILLYFTIHISRAVGAAKQMYYRMAVQPLYHT